MVVPRLTYVVAGKIIAALRWVLGEACLAQEQISGALVLSVRHLTTRCAQEPRGNRNGTLHRLQSLIRLQPCRLLLSRPTTRGADHLRARLVERTAAHYRVRNNATSIRRVITPTELTCQTLLRSLIPACTG